MGALCSPQLEADTDKGVSRPRISGQGTPIMVWDNEFDSGQGTPIMVWDNEFEKSIDLRKLIGMEGNDF